MDAKKIFDGVFGAPQQIRGIPVRLTAFDVNSIHRTMVDAFNQIVAIENEMRDLGWKMGCAKREFSSALHELEIRIHAQEKESGIGGTEFRIYKSGEEDGSAHTEY